LRPERKRLGTNKASIRNALKKKAQGEKIFNQFQKGLDQFPSRDKNENNNSNQR
jgi:hypothetical protein